MLRKSLFVLMVAILAFVTGQGWSTSPAHAINTSGDYESIPPFLTSGVPPLVMLVMGKDHKLYYEAYNDASDINQDGTLDIRYDTNIDYYGYFDSYKCYKYDTTRFYPYMVTTDKKCNKVGATYNKNQNQWSGNFLNYLTMSRMDTVRRVLYGGKRSVDTTTETVLERVFIPQDAHTWGKEYDPAVSGISIAMVAPLAEPLTGQRHLFASTTLSSAGNPLLRVVESSTKRIWEWVSKERPVADNSVSGAGSVKYSSSPTNHDQYDSLVYTFAIEPNLYGSGAPRYWSNSGYFGFEEPYGNPWTNIPVVNTLSPNYTGSSTAADQENYLDLMNGKLMVSNSGTYWFAVDGDDAVEFIITGVTEAQVVSGNQVSTGKVVVSAWYGNHANCGNVPDNGFGDLSAACTENWGEYPASPSKFKGAVSLVSGVTYDVEFRHQENTGSDNCWLKWKGPDTGNTWDWMRKVSYFGSGVTEVIQTTYNCLYPGTGGIVDYVVRVKVCDPGTDSGGNSLLERNCKRYPNDQYKPTGLLQTHGEADRMYFGLLTGSYRKNTAGGVVRKNISSFKDELDLNTGQFKTTTKGIVHTINTLKITNFDYGSYSYSSNCGWIASRPINAGECRNWGNPIAEMMYETLRYFTGTKTPTTDYTYTNADDDGLDLPKPTWIDPYSGTSSFSHCAKPFMLVISDVFPSFDSDQLPGVHSNFVTSPAFSGTLTSSGTTAESLDVEDLADTIWTLEGESSVTPHFIGQKGSTFDGSCAPKTMTGFGDVRGLCPEEPTKRGSYYSASVAYFGRKNDMSGVTGIQNVNTYVVALASPLPRIEIPVAGKTITLVPFAKSVGGYGISSAQGSFQPTNTICDFYVESISPTAGVFRINYEDVEQGADHDMDAICKYNYVVGSKGGVSGVSIWLESNYAAGSIIQHQGYTISGTTQDGTYLEVRDPDTTSGDDPDYFMDTPPGVLPHVTGSTAYKHRPTALPTSGTTRFFAPGTTTAATILKDPLWYAAKYGGFEEVSGTTLIAPDQQKEWDVDQDGTPDTYFYVVNPLKLEEQLNKSFAAILARVSSGTAASVISNSRSGEGAIYQSIFYATYEGEVSWVGEIHSFLVDAYGNMRVDTDSLPLDGNKKLDLDLDFIVEFNSEGLIDLWKDVDANGQLWKEADGGPDVQVGTNLALNNENIKYLWSTNTWLNEIDDVNILNQRTYTATGNQRYIFTFVDHDEDMIAGSGEQQEFTMPGGSPSALPSTADLTDINKIYPYIQPYPPFTAPAYISGVSTVAAKFEEYLQIQTRRIMHYIRGADQGEYIAAASGYTIPAFRNRKVDYDSDGTKETWRLGDIIHSTPTVIGRPQENYDLIYYDLSYADYYTQYLNRRSVVYCGANDGMFHAFNGGFYDVDNKQFMTQPYLSGTTTPDTSYADHALGAEIWAYVPYNLLPHLYWLTDPNYAHIYYSDLKPKVFDAKVWDETDTTHKNGWGTILVGGMRLGGGRIQADMNKADGATFISGTDRTMTSAFFILDITNPEAPPVVLAELAFPNLGYTTCYPTVVPMRGDKTVTTGVTTSVSFSENQWYLVLGSGPADASGQATRDPLTDVSSSQPGKIFMVDLFELVKNKTLKTMNSVGTLQTGVASIAAYASLDTNAFISDVISVDFNLDYNTDAVYFGTVQGSPGAWGGKLRRIKIDDKFLQADRTLWVGDSVLIDLSSVAFTGPPSSTNGEPITAAPSIALDADGNRWIYFGTGRFFTRTDAENADKQSYYGIKEPKSGSAWTWGSVTRANLLDMSAAIVYEEGDEVDNVNNLLGGEVSSWSGLLSAINETSGWYMDFYDYKERNLGQGTLLGDILTFTTYIPSLDPCEFEGYTNLYAVYYKTGTAYFESVIGLGTNTNTAGKHEVLRKTSLGRGLSITPNIHTGREEGSKIFVQTSTGAIEVLQQANPGMTKSGRVSWKEE